MYYTVYKTTNKINGKIYIGVHKTQNLDDGYMGSGKILKRAQEKYGIENFEKEILEVFDNQEEMFKMESQLVNEDFVNREDNYNLKEGGFGGYGYLNSTGLNMGGKDYNQMTIKGSMAALQKYNEDEGYRAERIAHLNKIRKKAVIKTKLLYKQGVLKGKPHTEETKEKLRESHRKYGHQKGEKNSNYGKIWVCNEKLKKAKLVPKNELENWIKNGWKKGAKFDLKPKKDHLIVKTKSGEKQYKKICK